MNNIKASDFIINELQTFIVFFPKTRVRYEFDIAANVHCIEVVPNQVYHLDQDYIKWENNFTDIFIELFPDNNICFFSDDAIVGINNIQFELLGSRYVDLISTIDCKSYINLQQIHILNSSNCLNIENISSSAKVFNSGIASKINQSNINIDPANSLTSIENQNPAFFSNNYPMAA
jgi:hypothetical protein